MPHRGCDLEAVKSSMALFFGGVFSPLHLGDLLYKYAKICLLNEMEKDSVFYAEY